MGPSPWAKRKLDIWPGFLCISVDIYFFKVFILQVFFEHLLHAGHCAWSKLHPEGMKMTH